MYELISDGDANNQFDLSCLSKATGLTHFTIYIDMKGTSNKQMLKRQEDWFFTSPLLGRWSLDLNFLVRLRIQFWRWDITHWPDIDQHTRTDLLTNEHFKFVVGKLKGLDSFQIKPIWRVTGNVPWTCSFGGRWNGRRDGHTANKFAEGVD